MVTGAEFLEFTFNGIVLGSILTLAAVGLTLVYGILDLANFAHGDFLTLGAYGALTFAAYQESTGDVAEAALPPEPWAIGIAILLLVLVGGDLLWKRWLERTERFIVAAGAGGLLLAVAGARVELTDATLVTFGVPVVVGAAAVAAYLTNPHDTRRRGFAAAGLAVALGLVLFLNGSKLVVASVLAIVFAIAFGLALEVSLWRVLRSGVLANATFVLFGGLLGVLVWMYATTQVAFLDGSVTRWFTLAVAVAAGSAVFWYGFREQRRIGRGNVVTYIIATIGLALALRSAIALRFGTSPTNYPGPVLRAEPLFAGVTATEVEVRIILISFIVIALVHVLLQYTKVGKAMRALRDNMDLARVSGIDVDRVILYVWALALGLTALAGILLAQKGAMTPSLGWNLLLYIFSAVILGGIGSAYGAMMGGFTIGLATEWTAAFGASEWKFAVAFVILILMLMFRPQGILGGRVA